MHFVILKVRPMKDIAPIICLLLCTFCKAFDQKSSTFLPINNANQSPPGSRVSSISHQYLNTQELIQNNIKVHEALVGLASRSIMKTKGDISLKRHLGDFDELNQILKGLILKLPDIDELNVGTVGFSDVLIWVSNMNCFDLSVEDILITHQPIGSTNYDFSVNIKDLAITCDLDWRYAYSLFSGNGSAQVYTTKSDADVTLRFESSDFNTHPPSEVVATSCNTAIEIDTLDLQGGIVAGIASLFKGFLTNTIETQINNVACGELSSLGGEVLNDVVDLVNDFLEQFLVDELPPEQDYLYAENNLFVPPEVTLVDFSTLGIESGDWFQTVLAFLNDFFGKEVTDTFTSSGVDLQINSLLRNSVLDNNRALNIDLDTVVFNGHDLLTETTIILDGIKLYGLDTMRSFESLERAGNHTILNNFSWEHLDVELDLTLIIKPSTKDDTLVEEGTGEIIETMKVTAGINDINAGFHFLLAIDKSKIGKIALGSIANSSNILPCMLDTLFQLEVTGFTVDATEVDIPTLSGFISPGIDRVITNSASAVFNMYEPTLIKVIPNIFQITVKDLLNGLIHDATDTLGASCSKIEFPSNETLLNFGDLLLPPEEAIEVGGTGLSPYGNILRDIWTLVEDELLKIDEGGLSYINDLAISKLTELQSSIPGTLLFMDEIGGAYKFELGEVFLDIELKASNVKIENIDTVGAPLSLLEPVSPQILNNTVGMGSDPNPLRLSLAMVVGLSDGDTIQMRNEIEVGVDIKGVLNMAANMFILENALMNFPLEDMLNYNCWLSILPTPILDSRGIRISTSAATLSVRDLGMAILDLGLNITCISCSSPLLEDLTTLFSSADATSDLTDLMNEVVTYITNLLGGSVLQVQIDRMLAGAVLQCPHHFMYVNEENYDKIEYEKFEFQKQPKDSLTLLFTIVGVVVLIILTAFCVSFISKFVKRRRLDLWMANLTANELKALVEKQIIEDDYQYRLNSSTTAMFLSPTIPLLVRICIPIIVIINICFFLSGHLSLGASVDLDVHLAGEALVIKELFVFSMAESIQDMWDAGAKELAILILIFSGIWPYTKQLAVLMLWFLPPRLVSVARRESIFVWLDILGKWSFVDIFVLILSLSSFRVAIMTSDDLSYLQTDFFKMNLLVVPCWGLYSNMIAQFISQFNSHYIIHYHRRVKSAFEEQTRLSEGTKTQPQDQISTLCKHTFNKSNMKKGKKMILRPIANIMLLFLAALFIVLVVGGCTISSYSLEQYGLVGLASSKPYVAHDVFSSAKLLIDQARFTGLLSDYIGLSVLSSVLILTVLVVPCVQLALSLVRWFKPLNQRSRTRLFVAIEALSAWQYIEVYLFSIIVASWQLGEVSQFLINDYCGGLEDTFATLQFYGILGTSDAQCFRVTARLESATWILIGASLTLGLINHFVSLAAAHEEEDLKHDSSTGLVYAGRTKRDNGDEYEKRDDDTRALRKQLRFEKVNFTDYYRCLVKRIQ